MAFNVLIVDDSSSMRLVIKKTIRASGFEVGAYWEAADGWQALEILSDEWVDLVLTDINMPNMNGLELITEMKKDNALESIPVVMVTTEGSEKIVDKCMAIGAKGYIKKPFMPEDIRRTLNTIMGETDDGAIGFDEDDEGCDF
jgi:two-component system, chemotaxis family, chemotaxis protein CheY